MLQAFKLADGTLIPFTSAYQVGKTTGSEQLLSMVIAGRDHTATFYFSSQEDRDLQLANFEKWLTTPSL